MSVVWALPRSAGSDGLRVSSGLTDLSMPHMPPALKALVAQLAGWAIAIALARTHWLPAGIASVVLTQVCGAVAVAAWLQSARWWLVIHALFAPLLLLAQQLALDPRWYLAAFIALALVYWSSFRTQVPLYLSNRATVRALHDLLPADRPIRLLDLGSGTGSLLLPLARARPDCRFTGIESAPATWLVSRMRARALANLDLQRGDFFAADWRGQDIVYAFLSPVPMTRVWEKACASLAPDALLISNSFPIAGVTPEREVRLDDRRGTTLYLYRPAHARSGKGAK